MNPQEKKMTGAADQLAVAFTSAPTSAEDLKIQARRFFDRGDCNGGKEYAEHKGVVNYLRHQCTNYDALRRSIRVAKLGENDNFEVIALKSQVLEMIAEKYPDLEAECLRQLEWMSTRAKAYEYSRQRLGLGVNGGQAVVDLDWSRPGGSVGNA
jgi:hypothetical protein